MPENLFFSMSLILCLYYIMRLSSVIIIKSIFVLIRRRLNKFTSLVITGDLINNVSYIIISKILYNMKYHAF